MKIVDCFLKGKIHHNLKEDIILCVLLETGSQLWVMSNSLCSESLPWILYFFIVIIIIILRQGPSMLSWSFWNSQRSVCFCLCWVLGLKMCTILALPWILCPKCPRHGGALVVPHYTQISSHSLMPGVCNFWDIYCGDSEGKNPWNWS